MQERQFNRVRAAVGVVLNVDGERVPCMSRNISHGGMFVLLKRSLPEGSQLEVEIIHNGARLHTRAVVKTVDEQGLGLRFTDVSDAFKQELHRFIDSLIHQGNESAGGAETSGHIHLAWSHLPDGKVWNFWRKRRHRVRVVNLSLDGAALVSGSPPPIGDTILLFLTETPEAKPERLYCRAQVVRHTDSGFAVQFLTPRAEFRRAVSQLRKKYLPSISDL